MSEPMSSHNRTERTAGYLFILIFAIMAMGIVLIGYLHYLNYEQNFRAEMVRELSSIAELKVGELALWRKERLGDGSILFRNTTFSPLVRRFLENPGDADAQRQLQAWMGKYTIAYQYTRVYLLDTQGRMRMSVPEAPGPYVSSVARNVTEILRSGKVGIEDFHRNTPDGPIHLAVVVPIFDETDTSRPLGVISLHIDPATYLYSFISRWPTPSQTAETLLVRRDGNDALFLSELRFRENAPLNLRIPLTKTEVPAVRAALGQTGVMEGVDYHGAPVIVAALAVPDSPWVMVARINTSEVYAPLREHLWQTITFVGILLFGSGGAMGFVWRQKSARYRGRDKAAEGIQESEARFRQLAEATFEGVAISESGRILDVNNAFIEMFGYEKAEELVGKNATELTAPEYRELAAERIAAGYEKPYEIMVIRKDGSTFPIEVHGRMVETAGRRIRITAVRDMTERKKAEKALRESEQKFLRFFMMVPVPLGVVNNDGSIVYFNTRFTEIFGYTRDDMPTIKEWWKLAYPDETYRQWVLGTWGAAVAKAAKEGTQIEPVEYKVTCRNGEERIVLISGITIEDNLLATFFDITERKRSEEALRKSAGEIEDIYNNAPCGYHSLDKDGVIRRINDTELSWLGYTRDEVIGRMNWTDVITPASLQTFRENFPKLKKDGHVNDLEIEIIRKDGTVFIGLVNSTAIYGSDGNFVMSRTTIIDITKRKRAEEELLARTQELSNAQKFAHMGSWELDIQTGKQIWSDEIYKMYGFTPGAFEPTFDEFMKIVHPDDKKTIEDYFPEILSGRLSQAEHDMRIIRPDGQERVLLDKLEVITDESGKPVKITGINFDITDRIRADEAKQEALNRLKKIASRVPGVVCQIRLRPDGSFCFPYASDTLLDLAGVSPEEVREDASKAFAAVHPDDFAPTMASVQVSARDLTPWQQEFRFKFEDGVERWVFGNALPEREADGGTLWHGVITDITERKKAEREREHLTLKLSQKAAENEAILASQNNVILSYDMNMDVQQVNPAFLRIYGFNPIGLNVKEIICRVNCRMIDGSPLNLEEQPTPRALRGKETDSMLYQVTKAGGTLGFVETSSRPLLIEDRIVGSVTVWHDITELKIKEDELRAAKDEAEAATELKDQFVSLVAHDLRSPFTSMMGLLRLLAERKPYFEDEESKKTFGLVFESGDRMVKMIEDLLKISRLQTGQITPNLRFFKGHMAAAVTIGSLSHLASQKGIVIMNDVPLDTRLYADQSLFDEVLLNLLSNAIKFCSRGDKITFFIPPGLKSAIAVRDTGKGINEAAIPNLFKHEVKTTTSGTAGEMGTGLGLPYSYDIMKAHGGDITVESAPGKGAVFTARLPYVKPVALVVDDEVAVRMLARIHLEKVGIDIIEAVDGEKALSAIKERRPHIVITDINMPGMDGFMLLDRLKQDISTRDIPVIVITAMEAETRENAFRHGADDFVRKPIEAEDFIPRVRRFVG